MILQCLQVMNARTNKKIQSAASVFKEYRIIDLMNQFVTCEESLIVPLRSILTDGNCAFRNKYCHIRFRDPPDPPLLFLDYCLGRNGSLRLMVHSVASALPVSSCPCTPF